jgi:hypothetical protein
MLTMKRNKKKSMKMKKLGEIFSTTPGNVISISVSSTDFPKSSSSESNSKGPNVNSYYEEMKPLFLILRIFGLLPYQVTSKGKFCSVNYGVSLMC